MDPASANARPSVKKPGFGPEDGQLLRRTHSRGRTHQRAAPELLAHVGQTDLRVERPPRESGKRPGPHRGFLLPPERPALPSAHMPCMEIRNDPKTRFSTDTAGHQMTVLLDQGLYRHLRFSRPGSSECWFEIVTSPNLLTINGDMGTFTFTRLEDMFQFFRRPDGQINDHYWYEKLLASDQPAKGYSAKRFTQRILEDATEQLDDAEADAQQRAEALSELQEGILAWAEDEREAADALDRFSHDLLNFEDAWEQHNFTEYSFHFLWNLHAIVDGITSYDAQSAGAAAAAA